MKIEKLNDNQIRATLSREDLESRHIRINEFAYGTDAARSLFNELLRFASYKLGFEVDDTPLMVEAIPISADSIVLLVTKIPYPEELDTRFSRFSDAPDGEEYYDYEEAEYEPGEILLAGKEQKATDILDVTETVPDEKADAAASVDTAEPHIIPPSRYTRLFRMPTIDEALAASRSLAGYYHGDNSLFRTKAGYELIVHIGDHSTDEFNRVINVLAEYGASTVYKAGTEDYLIEHGRVIVLHNALQVLAEV